MFRQVLQRLLLSFWNRCRNSNLVGHVSRARQLKCGESLKRIQERIIGSRRSGEDEFFGAPQRRRVIPARQARQGVIGHNVRLVLGFSLAAVVVVFAIIWIAYFA
jgi:hypothetical protein